MYLLALTISLCLAYLILYYFFPIFFGQKPAPVGKKSLLSVGILVLGSFLAYAVSFRIADAEMSNRVLHALGGGFLVYMICFLVVRDGRLSINKFQFFIFSFLIVTSLGVANEILEYFLQNYHNFIFALNANDTWLDLMSNVVGTILGAVCFTPFVKKI